MRQTIDAQFIKGAVAGGIAGYLLGAFGIIGVVLAAAGCYVLYVLYVRNTKGRIQNEQ
jgi:uncharacterized membrane protein YoaK (UPF0700 family)